MAIDITQTQTESSRTAALNLSTQVFASLRNLLHRWALWLVKLLVDVIPLAVVAGFFWLQIQVDVSLVNPIRIVVLGVLVAFELGLIFLWSLLRSSVSRN